MKSIAYVVWRDACTEEAREGGEIASHPLCELYEVGFLVAEGPESITLAMELDEDGEEAGRWRLHIPRVNIKTLKIVPVPTFLRVRKPRVPTRPVISQALPASTPDTH